jgi:stalled ribosome rescue protein Dom34
VRAPAATRGHVCVWIDHREARIFGIARGGAEVASVRESGPHRHIHRKADHVGQGKEPPDALFLDDVAAAVAGARALLLVGPGTARDEFASHLRQHHPEIATSIWGIEPMDQQSDRQIIGAARRFFRAAGRLRA